VGLRGIRIQNIVNELGGERIDVVQWDTNPARFVANALSPAQVSGVSVSQEDNTASVIVPDRQLSLAIGKEGQNARLAAKLTGWRIDIKSESAVHEVPATLVTEEAPAEMAASQPAEEPTEAAEPTAAEEAPAAEEALAEAEEAEVEEFVPLAEEAAAEPVPAAVGESAGPAKPQIRFAEEVFREVAGPPKGKKAKARKPGREEATPAAKVKKTKKLRRPELEEELIDDLEEV
jgi:N utilization substance protein A